MIPGNRPCYLTVLDWLEDEKIPGYRVMASRIYYREIISPDKWPFLSGRLFGIGVVAVVVVRCRAFDPCGSCVSSFA